MQQAWGSSRSVMLFEQRQWVSLKSTEFTADAGRGYIFIVETDASVLKIYNPTNLICHAMESSFGGKFLMLTNIIQFKVSQRSCNSVAHVLATHGAHMAHGGVMLA